MDREAHNDPMPPRRSTGRREIDVPVKNRYRTAGRAVNEFLPMQGSDRSPC